MKKLFLLIPALVLSLFANAEVININTSTADALRKALNNAQDGDIIEMAAGTYVESPSNYIAFDGKHVTVRAAEGAEVLIQPQVPITIANGGCAHFENVKIDASHLMDVNNWYSHSIYPTDASENNRIILDGCEMYGFNLVNSAIYCGSSYKLDAVSFNNCYFHDMMKSVLFIESTAGTAVQIANSTFANIETSSSYSAGVIDTRATSGSFSVDHCTFYNCQVINTDYGTIGKVATPGAVVSNCIFAMPTSTDNLRAIRDVATANNCLTYNYTKDSGKGIHGDVKKNNCIFVDPLFTDAANEDYSFAGDWTTMELSPARGAATDGSDLGDPRWYSDEVLPSTSFASPYQFVGAKAQISGNLWYDGTNEYLYYGDKSENGVATWKINATRACIIEATLNVNAATTNGHQFKVGVLDADGNSVAELTEASSTSATGDITLPGTISLAAGDYSVKLYNLTSWSTAKIDGVTFSYVGGAVQNMPGTTAIADAWFSSGGTRADSKIDFPDGYIQDGWVKWNVAFASAANYNVTVNIDNANGHNYTVALYEDEDDESPITLSEGGQKSTIGTLELGTMTVPAGNYILKVTNAIQYSDAKLISVRFTRAGGGLVNIPGDIDFDEVILSARAFINDNDEIRFTDDDHAGYVTEESAKWRIHAEKEGYYIFTTSVKSPNGQSYTTTIYNSDETVTKGSASLPEEGNYGYARTFSTEKIYLEQGNYVIKVQNNTNYSQGRITSLTSTYKGGATVNIPNVAIPLEDAILSTRAYIDGDDLHFTDADHLGTISNEWAEWNVSVASDGLYDFTAAISGTDKYSDIKLTVLDTDENELTTDHKGVSGSGSVTLSVFIASGTYIIKLANVNNYADGYLTAFSAATSSDAIVLDDNATDNNVITAADGQSKKIVLKRSFKGGMYNTLCVPFGASSSSELNGIFGEGYKILELSTATLDGDELSIEFTEQSAIQHGRPYLIKPTQDVENPVFNAHTIDKSTGYNIATGDGADFIGSFIKTTIDASEYNLFLGANDKLYFSNNDVTLKGMRAYFQIKNNGSGAPIRQARIVEKDNVVTELELINGEWQDIKSANGLIKTIENGQLILIRDGKRYNVMGIRF